MQDKDNNIFKTNLTKEAKTIDLKFDAKSQDYKQSSDQLILCVDNVLNFFKNNCLETKNEQIENSLKLEFFNLKENYDKLKEEYIKVNNKNKKLKENIKILQDKSINNLSGYNNTNNNNSNNTNKNNASDNSKISKVKFYKFNIS